jgi:hypothetical protein
MMDATTNAARKWQWTIGKAMIAVAILALVLAIPVALWRRAAHERMLALNAQLRAESAMLRARVAQREAIRQRDLAAAAGQRARATADPEAEPSDEALAREVEQLRRDKQYLEQRVRQLERELGSRPR